MGLVLNWKLWILNIILKIQTKICIVRNVKHIGERIMLGTMSVVIIVNGLIAESAQQSNFVVDAFEETDIRWKLIKIKTTI